MVRNILLPSNGLLYSPMASVSYLTNRDLIQSASTSYATLFDYYAQTVAEAVKIDGCNCSDILLCDMYFLYMYIHMFMTPHAENIEPDFMTAGICAACGQVSQISITASALEYSYRNPFNSPIPNSYFKNAKFKIKFRPRTICDNMRLEYIGGDMLEDYINVTKTYIATSAASVECDGCKVPQNEWFAAFDNMSEDDLSESYKIANSISRAGCGLSSKAKYQCPNCGKDAESTLFNDVMITSKSTPITRGENSIDIIKGLINTARYKVASYDELMLQPATETRDFMKAISATQFVSTMGGLA